MLLKDFSRYGGESLDDDSDQDLIITGIDDNNQNQAYYYTNLGNFDFLKEELFRNFSEGVQRGEIDIVDRDKMEIMIYLLQESLETIMIISQKRI